MYAAKRDLIEKQNPSGTQNEKELWHGTPEAAVVSINFYGFNRSYCRDNSSKYSPVIYIYLVWKIFTHSAL